jgi:hypothetical protein
MPNVLEVTEALDELLRAHSLPGQVWLLVRDDSTRKSGQVTGSFIERRHESELVMPFDIFAPLGRMYGTTHIVLDVPNPVPPKLMLPSIDGAAPALPAVGKLAADAGPTADDQAKARKLLSQAMKSFKPTGNGNGNGKIGG